MPEASNASVRIAVWLIGIAQQTGGFPVSLSMRQIANGFERDGVTYKGTGSRMETVKASLTWLEERGLLHSTQAEYSGYGSYRRAYTIRITKG